MTFIIYRATCLLNNKSYIGQTSKSLTRRQNQHNRSAINKSNFAFHRAIRKYGFDNFKWEILKTDLNHDQANFYEIYLIKSLKPDYNMTGGGKGITGFKHSNSTKNKISRANVGKNSNKLPWIKGRLHKMCSKEKIANSLGAKEFQVFKNDRVIGEWLLQSECAKLLGLKQSHISSCLLGHRKSHGGYTFKYK